MFKSVVVFPVPGGPNIRNIPVLLTHDCINAAHDLANPLPGKIEAFADGFEGHALFLTQTPDFTIPRGVDLH